MGTAIFVFRAQGLGFRVSGAYYEDPFLHSLSKGKRTASHSCMLPTHWDLRLRSLRSAARSWRCVMRKLIAACHRPQNLQSLYFEQCRRSLEIFGTLDKFQGE